MNVTHLPWMTLCSPGVMLLLVTLRKAYAGTQRDCTGDYHCFGTEVDLWCEASPQRWLEIPDSLA